MKFSYLLASPSGRGGAVEDCDGEGRHSLHYSLNRPTAGSLYSQPPRLPHESSDSCTEAAVTAVTEGVARNKKDRYKSVSAVCSLPPF